MSEETNIEPDVKQESVTKDENNVPLTRLNEVISERNQLRENLESFKTQEEETKRAKLQEEEKWQELNAELSKEVESYKPFKEKYDALDGKIRVEALSKLSESKQEKFKNLNTADLLNVVDELSTVKTNLPNDVGAVTPKMEKDAWKTMDIKNKRSNWQNILDSYK